ncbi:PREDICTED: b(0,+)-type amino acid transporter 1-like [Thamnophis sirtalis]|uniref:B(0,+)-type amino acid transporter 1-like n=1 Tax=Thamnophis sirtalis TaxID=35019 RepID=A0A6I9Z602_9SAUR|nr:PREDICTED: b(0,+)-type amino acid transporter 1-like [Thamnophis sirtalis]
MARNQYQEGQMWKKSPPQWKQEPFNPQTASSLKPSACFKGGKEGHRAAECHSQAPARQPEHPLQGKPSKPGQHEKETALRSREIIESSPPPLLEKETQAYQQEKPYSLGSDPEDEPLRVKEQSKPLNIVSYGLLFLCLPFQPDFLSMVHIRYFTPFPALIFTCVVSIIMVIPASFNKIVNLFSFTAWIFNGISVASLLYLKIKKPELPRSYKVPIIIPIIFLMISIYLVLTPIIDQPQVEFFYVILFILSGIIFYFPLVHYKYCPACLRKLTIYMQLLMEVAATEKDTK